MNLTIAIDDVNPLKGWRIFGDQTEKYLFDLNKTFGVKFTLFIPTNYHNEAPISKDKNWIEELKDSSIFELAAHGHYHQTNNPERFGEMEFAELNNEDSIKDRIKLMLEEWNKVEVKPKGWRNPGWICHPLAKKQLEDNFEYAALHYEHKKFLEQMEYIKLILLLIMIILCYILTSVVTGMIMYGIKIITNNYNYRWNSYLKIIN